MIVCQVTIGLNIQILFLVNIERAGDNNNMGKGDDGY